MPVEGGRWYNNPLYWYRDRNPFQSATKTTYTMSVNESEQTQLLVYQQKQAL